MSRAIGIFGASFCGSTVVNCILDGLSGVAGVGETHWIPEGGQQHCRACGPGCEFITPDFVDYLLADQSKWWKKWAGQMRVPTVVASEKWWAKYDQLGHPDHGLLVYRSPAPWVVSWIHHHRIKEADVLLSEIKPTEEELHKATLTWATSHTNAMNWLKANNIPATVLCFEDLTSKPEQTLHHLCHQLDLPFELSALDYQGKAHHHIAGNKYASVGKVAQDHPRYLAEKRRQMPVGLSPDLRHLEAITAAQVAAIEATEAIKETLGRLQS